MPPPAPNPADPARIVMKKTSVWRCWILVFAVVAAHAAQDGAGPAEEYQNIIDRIRGLGLAAERSFDFFEKITSVGPRLTGSRQAATAVELARGIMEELRLSRVPTEPVEVGRWVRGSAAEAIVPASSFRAAVPLSICALGGSVGTPVEGLTSLVVQARSIDQLTSPGESVKGKIIFFNRPMDRRTTDPFAACAAARLGAVAVLVRSLTFREDDNPHTGMLRYDPGAPRIPAAAVSTVDSDRLAELLEKERSVSVSLRMDCQDMGKALSANVVGEITGSELPHEIVLVGGHIDSWDLGVGAHDDAAGCAAALEAVGLLHDLGLRPRRTIRAVLFMDEEFGGTGGRGYAVAPQKRGEKHLIAAESDGGGFVPIGLAVGGREGRGLDRVSPYLGLLKPFGVSFLSPGGGGVDVAFLIKQGAIPATVRVNAQAYFDFHHSALDVVSSVQPRELELQAIILAALACVVAQEGI